MEKKVLTETENRPEGSLPSIISEEPAVTNKFHTLVEENPMS